MTERQARRLIRKYERLAYQHTKTVSRLVAAESWTAAEANVKAITYIHQQIDRLQSKLDDEIYE